MSGFPGFLNFLEKLGGKYFYYTAYQARKTFSELGSELAKILNFEQLEKSSQPVYKPGFQMSRRSDFLLMEEIQKNHPLLAQYFSKPSSLWLPKKYFSFLIRDSRTKNSWSKPGNKCSKTILKFVYLFSTKAHWPIFVGEKANNEAYSQEEIDLLTQFSYNIAIVLQNTQLHGQLEYLTQNLQKRRWTNKTAEIRKSYEVKRRPMTN